MHLYSCALGFFLKWTVIPPLCSCHMHMHFFWMRKTAIGACLAKAAIMFQLGRVVHIMMRQFLRKKSKMHTVDMSLTVLFVLQTSKQENSARRFIDCFVCFCCPHCYVALHTAYCILHTAYCILHTAYCILHTTRKPLLVWKQ
jgi:hypothetical protein